MKLQLPPILTERQVCLNLKKEFESSTVFFITHRLYHQKLRSYPNDGIWSSSRKGFHEELISRGRYLPSTLSRSLTLTDKSTSENSINSFSPWEGSSVFWSKPPLVFSFYMALCNLFYFWAFTAQIDQ